MKKIFILLMTFVLASSFVFAAEDSKMLGSDSAKLGDAVMTSTQNLGEEVQIQIQAREGNYTNSDGNTMRIQRENGLKLMVGKSEAKVSMEMNQETIENKTRLMVQLSNGMNSEIKVMPDVASERALEVLRAKCEERNCSIELKEVGVGNQTRAAYEVRTQKEARVFGLFRAQMNVQAHVDAETGELIQSKKPWWAFLATEPEASDETDESESDESEETEEENISA